MNHTILLNSFKNISDDVTPDTFKIKHTNYNEVRKILLGIKNDCSTGMMAFQYDT